MKKPDSTVSVSSSTYDTLQDFFLALSWVLYARVPEIMKNKGDRRRIFFEPLSAIPPVIVNGPKGALSGKPSSWITQTLRFLRDHSSNSLFLEMLNPDLREMILVEDFGDRTPVIEELLDNLSTCYQEINLTRDSYWKLKGQHEYRVSRLAARQPNLLTIAQALLSRCRTQHKTGLVVDTGLVFLPVTYVT